MSVGKVLMLTVTRHSIQNMYARETCYCEASFFFLGGGGRGGEERENVIT